MMNIALGGHSNLVTGLCRSVGLTYSGFSGTFTQHVTLVSIPKSFLVGEDVIAIIQGVFFDWSPQKSLSIEILYENT